MFAKLYHNTWHTGETPIKDNNNNNDEELKKMRIIKLLRSDKVE